MGRPAYPQKKKTKQGPFIILIHSGLEFCLRYSQIVSSQGSKSIRTWFWWFLHQTEARNWISGR